MNQIKSNQVNQVVIYCYYFFRFNLTKTTSLDKHYMTVFTGLLDSWCAMWSPGFISCIFSSCGLYQNAPIMTLLLFAFCKFHEFNSYTCTYTCRSSAVLFYILYPFPNTPQNKCHKTRKDKEKAIKSEWWPLIFQTEEIPRQETLLGFT